MIKGAHHVHEHMTSNTDSKSKRRSKSEEKHEDNDKSAEAKTEKKESQGMCGVIILAIAFFMIFFAYSSAQNLQTSLEGMTGYYSLGIIYVVFAISSLFAPSIIATIGEKLSMIIGGFCYVPFLFINAYPVIWLMAPSAFLCGIGAGLLWAAQGSALVKLAGGKENLGLASGVFFIFYQLNGVLGNLFTGFFLDIGHDLAVFITYGVLCIIGSLLFIPLRVPKNEELAASSKEASKHHDSRTMLEKLKSSFRIIFSKRMLWMVIPLVFSGTTTTYFMGKFPALIGRPRLSYIMAVLAAVDSVSSFIAGKLSDAIGRIPIILFGWFCLNGSNFLTIYASTFIHMDDGIAFATSAEFKTLAYRVPPNALIMFWVAAIGYGFYDSTMQTQLYSIFGLVFPDDPAAGFGAYRFVLAIVSGVWFICSAYVPVIAMGVLSSCLSVLFVIVIFLVDHFVAPLMPHKTIARKSVDDDHQKKHFHVLLVPTTPSPTPSPCLSEEIDSSGLAKHV